MQSPVRIVSQNIDRHVTKFFEIGPTQPIASRPDFGFGRRDGHDGAETRVG